MAAVPPPTAQGKQFLVAALRPKPKRGRGGGPGRDGDDAKQKMVPCSVCGHGDEMMQMFGPKRCAACDASDGQEEPSLSQATRASESEMEDDLASESEMEDEQVKTGEGKGNVSAMATRSRYRLPPNQRSLEMMDTLMAAGASDVAAAHIVADPSVRFICFPARGSVGREMMLRGGIVGREMRRLRGIVGREMRRAAWKQKRRGA